MKNTTIKRITATVIAIALAALSLCVFAGCEPSTNQIKTRLRYRLYNYDIATQTKGEEVDADVPANKRIQVGKYYALHVDITFDGLKATLGDAIINAKLTVNLGGFDNEANRRKQLYSDPVYAGMPFTQLDEGVWAAEFTLSADSAPDFGSNYFVIYLNSMGSAQNGQNKNSEPIAITLEESKSDYRFSVEKKSEGDISSNSNVAYISMPMLKGDIKFTVEDNIVITNLNSCTVRVPTGATGIAVLLMDEDDNRIHAEEIKYGENDIKAANRYLPIDFTELYISIMGETVYNQAMSLFGKIKLNVQITAEGGRNYGSESVTFAIELR